MRQLLTVLILCSSLWAQNEIIMTMQSDSSSRFDKHGNVIEATSLITVLSDDSSFIRTERTDTAQWKDGYITLNFGTYDFELTYIMINCLDNSDMTCYELNNGYTFLEWDE